MRERYGRASEEGYTMLAVVGIFVILTILGMSIILLSSAAVKTSTKERDDQAVFYTAESGITVQMNEIREIIKEIYETNANLTEALFYEEVKSKLDGKEFTVEGFENASGRQIRAIVQISLDDESEENNKYVMTSTGLIGEASDVIGQAKRTVENTFVVQWNGGGTGDLPPFALFTRESLSIPNGGIVGDIGSKGKDANGFPTADLILNFPGHTNVNVNGNVYVPNEVELTDDQLRGLIGKGKEDVLELLDYPFPTFPNADELDLGKLDLENFTCPDKLTHHESSNKHNLVDDCSLNFTSWVVENVSYKLTSEKTRFKNMNFNSQINKAIIDVGDTNKTIFVENFSGKGSNVILKGTGNLTIYVANKFDINSSIQLNHPESGGKPSVSRLNVLYYGDQAIKMSGDGTLNGSLYSKSTKANIDMGASGKILGNVISNAESVKLNGGTSLTNQLVLAPNAILEVSGGGSIKGSVFAKKAILNGGTKIEYVPPEDYLITGPLSYEKMAELYTVEGGQVSADPTLEHVTPIKEKRN